MTLNSAYYVSFHIVLVLHVILLPVVRGITYTLQEEVPVDYYIGNVSADSGLKEVVGADRFDSLRYSILSGRSPSSHLFKVSATTGILTVASRIDREQLCPYADACQLTIEIAAQYESLLRNFNVQVVVQDINDNSPEFPRLTLAPIQLSESTSVDFPVSLDAAKDLDGSQNFSVRSYSLLPEDLPFRVVHAVNLVGVVQLSLVVSQQLDRETRSSYNLTLWAYDGGYPPRSGSVAITIIILDVNDNAPVFIKDVYVQNINETTPIGTPIVTISARDADEGDNAKVLYSISTQQPMSDQAKFTVDATSGVVAVRQNLRTGVHRVLVEAQDQGSPPKPPTQAVVEVTVLDTDNSPPVLNLDMLSLSDFEPGHVPESTKISTAVGFLAVSDPDSGANAKVTCESQNQHFELQSLNLNEYKIIISEQLDRENSSSLNVVLSCFDDGSPKLTSTATFEVWILDVNDNPPVFLETQYSTSVAENNGASDGLLQVAATDADAGRNANITYRLVGDENKFQVGMLNGLIKAKSKFDFEEKDHYVFTVLAIDQGEQPLTATATVTINILDVNDEAPRFSHLNYSLSVPEDGQAGLVVGNLSAFDPDTGLGGEVVLTIAQQPGLTIPFALSISGLLTVASALDRELRAVYSFYVLASDRGSQPLTSSALVTVHVLDVNDNAPTFVFIGMNFTESISVPVLQERVVVNVRAIDPDGGVNGSVTYSIVGGNASDLFRVEQNTGAIVTLVDLDERRLGRYQLVIRATDQGKVPLQTNQNLTIALVQKGSQGQVMGNEEDDGETYVIIVICIVLFTALVSAAVLVTMCVLRRLDQNKQLKYAAGNFPDDEATPVRGSVPPESASDYHQQVSLENRPNTRTSTVGGSLSDFVDCRHPHLNESAGLSVASETLQQFAGHRPSSPRTAHLPLTLSHMQQGRKTPLQLDAAKRVDDFHSTSSTETTTGDSGHGSDEDIANHSHDRPLSPQNSYNHPPPRPLRLGRETTSPFPRAVSSPVYDSSLSSRPIFVREGQFRGSKPHSNSVRFSDDVPNMDFAGHSGRRRYPSNDSFREEESDLSTTTSGSFSVPPDDLYSNYNSLAFNATGASQFPNDMLV